MVIEPANEIRSICDLVMRIREKGTMRIVGIEGFCSSGKTSLGKRLAAQLNPHFQFEIVEATID